MSIDNCQGCDKRMDTDFVEYQEDGTLLCDACLDDMGEAEQEPHVTATEYAAIKAEHDAIEAAFDAVYDQIDYRAHAERLAVKLETESMISASYTVGHGDEEYHHGQCDAYQRAAEIVRESAAEYAALKAERDALREALEIIAGKRQCVDDLMGNVDVALAALAQGEVK